MVDVAVEGTQASRASILPTSIWESKEDARKEAGAWSEALCRLKTTSSAGEGGRPSARTSQSEDGLQSLSDGTVNKAKWEGGQVEANRGTEGPSLSTMWSAAERAHQETKQIGNFPVHITASQQFFPAQNDLDSSSPWVKICTSLELELSVFKG